MQRSCHRIKDAVLHGDSSLRFFWFESFCKLLGCGHFYSAEELATAVQPIIAAALEHGIGRGEVTRLRRDGTQFPARITLSLLRDDAGELIGRVLCVQDTTAQRQLEEELRHAALYDPLTRLPNRRLLRDRVEHALVLRARRQTGVAAMFVDLDGFKRVNDAFGHEVGDEVLVEVARRLLECVRPGVRHGDASRRGRVRHPPRGARQHRAGERDRATRAPRVRPSAPYSLARNIPVSASIGVHVATDEDDYQSLLHAADNAMYDAKRSGSGGIRFSPPQPMLARPIEPVH